MGCTRIDGIRNTAFSRRFVKLEALFSVALLFIGQLCAIECQKIEVSVIEDGQEENYSFYEDLDAAADSYRHTPPHVKRRDVSSTPDVTSGSSDVDFSKLTSEECARLLGKARSRHGGQVALMVELGETAVLPCHVCPAANARPMNWYRLHRQSSPGGGLVVWRPLEVEVDTYDDQRLNRIMVQVSHHLVIRDFQPDDVGSYFCVEYDVTRRKQLSQLSFRSQGSAGGGAAGAALAWSSADGKGVIDMVVHVDVEIPRKERLDMGGLEINNYRRYERHQRGRSDAPSLSRPASPGCGEIRVITVDTPGLFHQHHQVTRTGSGYPRPSGKHVDESRNLEVYTHWTLWSNCTLCGVTGERRRRGSCFVKLANPSRSARPAHLDHALRFYPRGAPCHSSLLTHEDVRVVPIRPPEVQVEQCNVECVGASKSGLLRFSKFVKKAVLEDQEEPVEYFRRAGDRLQLSCPEAADNDPVLWRNDSQPLLSTDLAVLSGGRVEVDVYNSLVVHSLLPADDALYTCSVHGHRRAAFRVRVRSPPATFPDVRPALRVLAGVFGAEAAIFIALLAVRHRQRLVQVRRVGEERNKKGSRSSLRDGGRTGPGLSPAPQGYANTGQTSSSDSESPLPSDAESSGYSTD